LKDSKQNTPNCILKGYLTTWDAWYTLLLKGNRLPTCDLYTENLLQIVQVAREPLDFPDAKFSTNKLDNSGTFRFVGHERSAAARWEGHVGSAEAMALLSPMHSEI